MGFATMASNLRTAMLADALGWATDFSSIIAAVTGLMIFGAVIAILRRFI